MSCNKQSRMQKGNQSEEPIDAYTDKSGVQWLGKIRDFANKPIFTYAPLGKVGHIMIGRAVVGQNTVAQQPPLWFSRFEERCELEVYCRYHGLPVPKARSAELPRNTVQDIEIVCSRLERENAQMQRRLDRYHAIQRAKHNLPNPSSAVNNIVNDTSLMSDCELSDFSDDDDLDDFVSYLPNCLNRCC